MEDIVLSFTTGIWEDEGDLSEISRSLLKDNLVRSLNIDSVWKGLILSLTLGGIWEEVSLSVTTGND